MARGTWRETHEVIFADAALSQIGTVGGTAQTQVLPIESATALPDHRVTLQLDPVGGAHATAEELQYQLPGELEFGHSTPIVGNEVTVGPFTPGITINFRTHISNSNPGFVTSDVVSAVA